MAIHIDIPSDPSRQLSEVCILDTEACGIDLEHSYPIEIAWLSLDSNSEDSFLINPLSANGWDGWGKWAEDIHHIPRETCIKKGLSVNDAAARLNSQLGGCIVVTDAVSYDLKWMKLLFEQTPFTMDFHMVDIRDYALATGKGTGDINNFIKAKRSMHSTHRALDDCQVIRKAGQVANIFPTLEDEA